MARPDRMPSAMVRGARVPAAVAILAGALALPAPAPAQPSLAPPAGQGEPRTVLPSLVLPPAATTEPQGFETMMRSGDTAMVRGDIVRARALYERAATMHPRSSAAAIAAGKTYDPNLLPLFGAAPGLADIAKARGWYDRARAVGDPAAAALLDALR